MRLPKLRPNSQVLQLAVACAGMVGGSWLIGLWMVGIMLMAAGGLVGLDALLVDRALSARERFSSHEDVLERYRRAS